MPPVPEEPDDLGRLYDRLGPSLYRYALMILADPAAAEDVVHDVFAAMVRRRVGGLESVEAYLRLAVRNASYSVLRTRRRQAPAAETDAALLEAATDESPPEERLALAEAMRGLPPDQREVVHLKMYEGLTFQAIADLTGESINTIAGRYRYAIEKLRAALGARR
jgi:RNA polymerase sigma-70 factor (ECF subfamily)